MYDFEFLEASGKQLCVPAHTAELEWTRRAVKELAGSGCVYVWLIDDGESDSDSGASCNSPEVKVVKIETQGAYYINNT